MNTCLIISGGDFSIPADTIQYDFVIACDKGLEYANKLNIVPNLIIGDFDSYTGNVPTGDNVLTYPSQKDDSDTMLAIRYALNHSYNHIIIICALGGRMDHTIANIQTMHFVAANGGVCEIISDTEHLMTFTGPQTTIPAKVGYSISLFSLSDACEGVTISGAGYNAQNISLTNSFPIGLSNYWDKDCITLTLSKGILLISMSKLER